MRTKTTAIGAALAALAVLCAMFASSASAAPAWKFEAKALEGTEVVPRRCDRKLDDDPGPDHQM